MLRVGIIGYGLRIKGMVDTMQSLNKGTEVVAIADPGNDTIKARMIEEGKDASKIAFYSGADDMLDREKLDGVMIGTRCSLHTQMGIKVLPRRIPMLIEKPIATNMNDLLALRNAAGDMEDRVVVSFPLRVTPLVQLAKEIIDSGKIGTVEHVQAWNNVPYGRVYYQYWYRDENETQGLWLQKATHDFDYINYLLGTRPAWICARDSKRIYKGDHPAGLRCIDCAEADSCADHPTQQVRAGEDISWIDLNTYGCGFAVDTGNEDSGSAIVEYETGMHVSYSQNFFARKAAGARGARLLGYKGTLEFDWYTDELKVFMHHTPRVESYKLDSAHLSHGGGDHVLTDSFIRVMKGEGKSVAPLSAGLLSVLMCLKAKESSATRTFQEIRWPE